MSSDHSSREVTVGAPRSEIDLLKAEVERLRHENALLREKLDGKMPSGTASRLAEPMPTDSSVPATGAELSQSSPTAEKISLFLSLFRGRADVYPLRWENMKGKTGFSPACGNEWKPVVCQKPRIKCTDCPNQAFLPLTDEVAYDHLVGRRTIGIYPLLKDETCWFLTIDFDEKNWKADIGSFFAACNEFNVPVNIEVSRSGNGAHAWCFFAQPVPARLARELGSALITRTCARARQLSLSSYDRLFPNQDTLPKGGFGNLIALPLQKGPREHGHSVFVDENLRAFADQWAYLAAIRDEIETSDRAIAARRLLLRG